MLFNKFDPESLSKQKFSVSGVPLPALFGRTTISEEWTRLADTYHWQFERYDDMHAGYVRPIGDALESIFAWPVTRQLVLDNFHPGDPLRICLNMDAFPVESDMHCTLFSMALVNMGPISKSPLLRYPLGLVNCRDKDRDVFASVFKSNITAINSMIDTGVVDIRFQTEGGEETLRFPVTVRRHLIIVYHVFGKHHAKLIEYTV
jgi:hypothetical protein